MPRCRRRCIGSNGHGGRIWGRDLEGKRVGDRGEKMGISKYRQADEERLVSGGPVTKGKDSKNRGIQEEREKKRGIRGNRCGFEPNRPLLIAHKKKLLVRHRNPKKRV